MGDNNDNRQALGTEVTQDIGDASSNGKHHLSNESNVIVKLEERQSTPEIDEKVKRVNDKYMALTNPIPDQDNTTEEDKASTELQSENCINSNSQNGRDDNELTEEDVKRFRETLRQFKQSMEKPEDKSATSNNGAVDENNQAKSEAEPPILARLSTRSPADQPNSDFKEESHESPSNSDGEEKNSDIDQVALPEVKMNNNDESDESKRDVAKDGDSNQQSHNSTENDNEANGEGEGEEHQKHLTEQQTRDSDLSPSPSTVSTKTNNDNEDNNKDNESATEPTLGRNRRVRQKNRYFADFHCMQLVKGCRSKDDYDAYSPSTSATRSSNRRSTTDSSRGTHGNSNQKDDNVQDPTELFVTRYCRKCSDKTPHDDNTGCQACLYKKIVSTSKRQKTLSSRSRASNRQQQQQKHDQQKELLQKQKQDQLQGQLDQEHQQEPEPEPLVEQQEDANISEQEIPCLIQQKRLWKIIKRRKSPDGKNVINISVISSKNAEPGEQLNQEEEEPKRKVISKTNDDDVVNEKMIDSGESKKASDSISVPETNSTSNSATTKPDDNVDGPDQLELTKPDTWTPDQVAQYVSLKGFANESDLFRQQTIDGISLLMMKRTDFTHGLKMKLGPALKLYEQVCRLRRDYDRETASAS